MQVNVHEAKTQLSRLLELVENDERVIIARHGRPVAELVPARQKGAFPLGIARENQLVPAGDACWQPLSDKKLRTGLAAMKVLTDTHTLVWALSDPDQLSSNARQVLTQAEVLASVANLWELLLRRSKVAHFWPIPFHGGQSMYFVLASRARYSS